MAIGTRLGPNGLPIDEGFFGNQGLGGALASLPGTPILDGGRMPVGPGGEGLTPGQPPPGYGAGTPAYDPTTDPNVPGGGFNGYRSDTGYGSPLAGSTPQTNPGTPPPPSTAGTSNFFGGQSPWAQNVGASINDQPVSFASPGNPNPNYITPEAASKIGQEFGANVVEQNRSGMSSPGSGAPSQPLYGLDFGTGGDVQDAGMGAFQLARGDRPEDVAARYKAGLTTTGWGGPAPKLAENWDAPYWNRSNPVSTYDPAQSSPDQAQLIAWLRSQIGG